jgi:predicted transposase/invertase (TIGR01784 family)
MIWAPKSISQDAEEQARSRAWRKFQMDLERSRTVSFEEGWGEGWAEGKLKSKLKAACNLLANGVSLEIIAKNTGLSLSEIQALEK